MGVEHGALRPVVLDAQARESIAAEMTPTAMQPSRGDQCKPHAEQPALVESCVVNTKLQAAQLRPPGGRQRRY
jgi:hypothetical protein